MKNKKKKFFACKKNKMKRNSKEDKKVLKKGQLSDQKLSLKLDVNLTSSKKTTILISKLTKNKFSFIMVQIIGPCILLWGICCLNLGLQILIKDLCFQPGLCECENFGVYIYTNIKLLIDIFSIAFWLIFYMAIFITEDFYNKRYFKNVYIPNCFVVLTFFYGYDYESRFERITPLIIRRNGIIVLLWNFFFIIILTYEQKKINKIFLKKLVLCFLFSFLIFGYVLYLKSYGFLFLLDLIKQNNDNEMALCCLKIFLLIFSKFYEFIMEIFLKSFYKIIKYENKISMNFLHFFFKLILMDVYTLQIFNMVTTKFENYAFWLTLIVYVYSLFAQYAKISIFQILIKKFYRYFSKKQYYSIKNENSSFGKIKNVCLLEANFVIFLRGLTYVFWGHFIIIGKEITLYSDCSLKELPGNFEVFYLQLIFLLFLHFFIIFSIMIYSFRKEKNIFDCQEERLNLNILGRIVIFVTFFNLIDHSLQIYKEFHEFK